MQVQFLQPAKNGRKWYGFGSHDNDNIGFIIAFNNEKDVKKGIECCEEGISAWFRPELLLDEECAEDYPHLTKEDYDGVYFSGFCETAEYILAMENITDYEMEFPYDEEGNLMDEYKDYDIEMKN